MKLFNFLRQLYSLDTLDTRITTSSSTPLDTVQKEREAADQRIQNVKHENNVAQGAQPAKWNTPEFYLYALVFILAVPMMFKSVMDVSQGI